VKKYAFPGSRGHWPVLPPNFFMAI